jgi:hypothetical protein
MEQASRIRNIKAFLPLRHSRHVAVSMEIVQYCVSFGSPVVHQVGSVTFTSSVILCSDVSLHYKNKCTALNRIFTLHTRMLNCCHPNLCFVNFRYKNLELEG